MKKKILNLILLSSIVSVFSVNSDNSHWYIPDKEYLFATATGGVAGAGLTLWSDRNAPVFKVVNNALIGTTIADVVFKVDKEVKSPEWLPEPIKKTALIAGGCLALHLFTRK